MKTIVQGGNRSAGSLATVRFLEIPIGGRFEFRGRRYEKVGGGFASDEERMGNCFQADTEVVMESGRAGARFHAGRS
ncbi:MAG: hypothetical protein WCR20_05005 [Verrucomicrobiota bacterium]|jgi:hypothetical protein|nr:hypothetical protein [Verrucomicrobiota bacterium]